MKIEPIAGVYILDSFTAVAYVCNSTANRMYYHIAQKRILKPTNLGTKAHPEYRVSVEWVDQVRAIEEKASKGRGQRNKIELDADGMFLKVYKNLDSKRYHSIEEDGSDWIAKREAEQKAINNKYSARTETIVKFQPNIGR